MHSIISHVSRLIVTFARPLLITTLSCIAVGAASGQTWTQLTPTGGPPSARGGTGSAYDPATNQMIIFGGEDSLGNNLNDVWTLTLGAQQQWTQVPIAGSLPAGRLGPGASYDSVNSRLIVFGGGLGHTSPCVNDVWVLSNANGVGGLPAWTQLSPSGTAPPPRWGASAIYAPASNTMTIFGGNDCFSTNYNDVWVLSNANGQGGTPVWTQLSPAGTAPSAGHTATAVYDPGSNRMIIYGFIANPDQVWVLTNANGLGGTPTWIQLSPLAVGPPKFDQATVYDPSSNSMIVFGGFAGTALTNDTWVLSNANGLGGTPNWTQLSPSGGPPASRCCMATVYDPATKRMVIFGGGGNNSSSLNDTWMLTFAPSTSVQIRSISPATGGNAGTVTARIFGNGFQSGATVKLAGVGPDIVGTNTTVTTTINTSVLGATFDLTGASPGVRDVVVTNPDGSSATVLGGFNVQQGGAPQISVDIVGLDRIRFGRAQTYYLVVRNSGNIDAGPDLISFSFPSSVVYDLAPGSDLFSAGSTADPAFAIPLAGHLNDTNLVFATAGVSAGGTQFQPIGLTLPASGAGFTMIAADPVLTSISFATYAGSKGVPIINFRPCAQCDAAGIGVAEINAANDADDAFRKYQSDRQALALREGSVLALALKEIALAGLDVKLFAKAPLILQAVKNLAGLSADHFFDDSFDKDAFLGDLTLDGGQLISAGAVEAGLLDPPAGIALVALIGITKVELAIIRAAGPLNPTVLIVKADWDDFVAKFNAYTTAWTNYKNCLQTYCGIVINPGPPPCLPNATCLPVTPVSSLDPNDKTGALGAGGMQYVSGAVPLPYAIYFSNEATATAPAQQVSASDQLDVVKDNLNSLSLGPISFGSELVSPSPSQTSFAATVDLRPTTNLLVAISANLNPSTGLLTWNLQSLDPATNQPPTDPTVGFLPPGGEGSVFFTVMPKQGLSTNTQIQNQATVVFDVNVPINTPTWTNTIDNTPPTSQVTALPATEFSPSFPVAWSGTDVGAGIQDFTIYASDNGGPFTAFQTNTTATSATFTGQLGHTYGFYSIARDLVGNVEGAKTAAEATTQVTTDTTPPVTTATLSPQPNAAGWNNSNVTVTLTSTDDEPGGTGVKQITYSAAGAQTIANTFVNGGSASFTISTEGITTITFFGTDNAGNIESAHTLTIQLDKTPPTVACSASPNVLWPPNNKLVSVNLSVTVSDALSGPAGFTLVSVTNNEPDSGQGDVQGFVTGTASTSGQLRATRLGSGTGRVYTLTYSGSDKAGNTASCTTTVAVPHDQGQN